jgi:mono/diheme cytochrome c family protein
MRTRLFKAVIFFALILALAFIVASQINLSALPEPGPFETRMATASKRWIIARAARKSVPAEPNGTAADQENGDMLYGMDCDSCHGKDGRHPTSTGRWMYPRVLDLGSPEVQGWSDAELFWIVKNGVRFSGMPAFGKVQSDKEIWDLVRYVRSLGGKAATSK